MFFFSCASFVFCYYINMKEIACDNKTYQWSEEEQGFFGVETPCGTFGAVRENRKWLPAWYPTDSSEMETVDKEFEDCKEAIRYSHIFFS